jgi:glycosyltransferase involved in cell wall biosynthesis
MMRVLEIIYTKSPAEIYNRKAALGSYIYSLAGLLQDSGKWQVRINGEDFSSIRQSDVPSGSQGSRIITKLIPSFLKRYLKQKLLLENTGVLTEKIASKSPPDAVLEFYSFGSNAGYRIACRNKIPLVVVYDAPVIDEYEHFHGAPPFSLPLILGRQLETLSYADAVVVYSTAVGEYLEAQTKKKLPLVIHQNVDFSRFDVIQPREPGSVITIGFIGSFLKWHNVPLLVRAFEQLRDSHEGLRLLLLGTGEQHRHVLELVNRSRWKNDILAPGFADGSQLLEYKRQIDIGVMPGSNWYGAPNKIFEYGAAGIPVVAVNTPTIKELFEFDSGVLLFNEDDENGLATALEKLCSDKDLMQKNAAALQKKILQNYSKNNTFELYNSLIGKARK